LLYTAVDIGYIGNDLFDTLYGRTNKINGLINGFISYLKNNLKRK